MQDFLRQFIFSWPSLAASLLALFSGLLLNRASLLVVAAILFAPYAAIRGSVLLIVPLLDFGAAWAVISEKTWLAWVLSLPSFFIGGWILWLAINP